MTTQTDANPYRNRDLAGSPPLYLQEVQVQSGIEIPPPVSSPFVPQSFHYGETSRRTVTQEDQHNVKKFVERKHYRTDRFEYDRQGNEPGFILIFNQENFDNKDLGTRRGSRRDVNELAICFQRQGFNVDPDNIITDATTEAIKQKLREVADMDFSDYNCLILFFLSHGEEYNRLDTKDGTIGASDIWNEFKRTKSLLHKPKMFVFQACKGDGYSTTGVKAPPKTPTSDIVPIKTFNANYLYSDMLIVHSSIEGNSSFRNMIVGSWFIQELCKNFTAYGKRDDVISLIIRTTKCVAGNYYHNKENEDQKQMPLFISTLKKKFYLNRNKDRDIIIRIAESNEEILKTMREIKNQLSLLLSKDENKKTKK